MSYDQCIKCGASNADKARISALETALAAMTAERDKVSEQCDDFMRSLGVDALGVDAEIWAQPSAHGNDRLRWAVLICQKIEERKKERDEQAEAVRVLAGECCEWRVAHVCSPVSLIDAPIIRARKRTMNNPIARAAVEGEKA